MEVSLRLFYQHQYVKLLRKERIGLSFRFTFSFAYTLISRFQLIQVLRFIRISSCLQHHFVVIFG